MKSNSAFLHGKSLRERWEMQVQKGPDCWEWQGTLIGSSSCKYGQLRLPKTRKRAVAHRVAYELFVGDIPPGLWVLHSCDNPKCVRPEHLHLGTAADNSREMCERNRAPTGSKNGAYTKPEATIKRGSKNGNSKLTELDVEMILKEMMAGASNYHIATTFMMGLTQVRKIRRGLDWKQVYQEVTKDATQEQLRKLLQCVYGPRKGRN